MWGVVSCCKTNIVGDEICDVLKDEVSWQDGASTQLLYDAGSCSDDLPDEQTLVDTLNDEFCGAAADDYWYQEKCYGWVLVLVNNSMIL